MQITRESENVVSIDLELVPDYTRYSIHTDYFPHKEYFEHLILTMHEKNLRELVVRLQNFLEKKESNEN